MFQQGLDEAQRLQTSINRRSRTKFCPESIDNVHGSDSLPLSVLGVGDSISDDVLQEHLQDAPRLLIDETTNPLDSASSSQSSDRWLGDALNVIPQDFTMPLGASLPQALSSFATSSHNDSN